MVILSMRSWTGGALPIEVGVIICPGRLVYCLMLSLSIQHFRKNCRKGVSVSVVELLLRVWLLAVTFWHYTVIQLLLHADFTIKSQKTLNVSPELGLRLIHRSIECPSIPLESRVGIDTSLVLSLYLPVNFYVIWSSFTKQCRTFFLFLISRSVS